MRCISNGVRPIGNLESVIGLWIMVENKKSSVIVGVKEDSVGNLGRCKERQPIDNLLVPKD